MSVISSRSSAATSRTFFSRLRKAGVVFTSILLTLSTVSLIAPSTSLARDDGRYANSPLKEWFNSLRNKQMVPCCDTADGVRLEDVDWEASENGYRVRIEGQWIPVPPEALIEQPNRAGPAIVWPYKEATGKTAIRCFIPGAGS